jgi:hypothetical protein
VHAQVAGVTEGKNARISISSIPLLASASTLAAAWLRALRQTLGVLSPV